MLDTNEIRQRVASFRNELSNKERDVRSNDLRIRLKDQMFKWDEQNRFFAVLCFYPLKKEVDLIPLYEEFLLTERRLFFPKIIQDDLHFYRVESLFDFKEGSFGVMEPKDTSPNKELFSVLNAEEEDVSILCITPGVAFSKDGHRIGFGRGYYDRFFSNFITTYPKIKLIKTGVCFTNQIYTITPQPHDVDMDVIITEI